MKIIHSFHSGFIIKVKDRVLVFDCLDTNLSKHFSDKDNVYVFISHGHSDHFERKIFDWERKNSRIKYFLGYDIEMNESKENYYSMESYQSIDIEGLNIQSFGSTDRGISFLVTIDDIGIFHAGDLNWWHWENDSKDAQRKEAEDFKKEVNLLTDKKIDIAFVPVDPRLGEYYYLSAEYFAKIIEPKLLVPMHFSSEFSITKRIKNKLKEYNLEVLEIKSKNQEFDISIN